MNKKSFMDTRTMVKAAFLTAISIVLTRFLYFFIPLAGLPTLRISFGEVPLMMSGLLFGPVVGGISGIAADFIGVLVNSQGTFHPGFTLSSMLWGAIPGLYLYLFKKQGTYEKIYSFKNVFIAVLTCYIIISLGLNTLWLTALYGKGFFILLPGRIIAAVVNVPLQSIIIVNLLKYLKGFVKQ